MGRAKGNGNIGLKNINVNPSTFIFFLIFSYVHVCLHSFEHMIANTWVCQQSSIFLQLQKELQVVVSHLDMVAGAQSPFLWRSRILLSTAQLSLQSLMHTFVRDLTQSHS